MEKGTEPWPAHSKKKKVFGTSRGCGRDQGLATSVEVGLLENGKEKARHEKHVQNSESPLQLEF